MAYVLTFCDILNVSLVSETSATSSAQSSIVVPHRSARILPTGSAACLLCKLPSWRVRCGFHHDSFAVCCFCRSIKEGRQKMRDFVVRLWSGR